MGEGEREREIRMMGEIYIKRQTVRGREDGRE